MHTASAAMPDKTYNGAEAFTIKFKDKLILKYYCIFPWEAYR